MTAAVVVGAIAAYLMAGAGYARSQVMQCHRRAREASHGLGDIERMSLAIQLWWRALAWPCAVLFDGVRGHVSRWFLAPLDRHRERIAQLRRDAKTWDDKRRNGTEAEREMAAELARMCREQADELERAL